jgi:hypothetical protein
MPYADSDYERSWKMQTKGVTPSPVRPEYPTPGPWYCHVQTAVAEESDGDYGTATCITTADAESYSRTGDRGDIIAWVPHDRGHRPNARLIASAPELLDVLKRLLQCSEEYPVGQYHRNEVIADCKLVIAKAEGRGE